MKRMEQVPILKRVSRILSGGHDCVTFHTQDKALDNQHQHRAQSNSNNGGTDDKDVEAQFSRLREVVEAVRQGPSPLPSTCIYRSDGI